MTKPWRLVMHDTQVIPVRDLKIEKIERRYIRLAMVLELVSKRCVQDVRKRFNVFNLPTSRIA